MIHSSAVTFYSHNLTYLERIQLTYDTGKKTRRRRRRREKRKDEKTETSNFFQNPEESFRRVTTRGAMYRKKVTVSRMERFTRMRDDASRFELGKRCICI